MTILPCLTNFLHRLTCSKVVKYALCYPLFNYLFIFVRYKDHEKLIKYSLCFKLYVHFERKILFQISCPLQLSIQIHISKVNSTPHTPYLYFLDQPHSTYFHHLMQLICEHSLFLNCVIFLKWTSNLKRREYVFLCIPWD